MLVPHNTNSIVEFTDFQLGYQIINEHSRKLADYYLFNRSEEDNAAFNESIIEEEVEGLPFDLRLSMKKGWDQKFKERMSSAALIIAELITISATKKVTTPDGIKEVVYPLNNFLLNYVEHMVTKLKIIWNNDYDAREQNFEMVGDISESLIKTIIRNINISAKLYNLRETFREFWGDSTDIRFEWTINRFAPEYVKIRTSEEDDSILDEKCSNYTIATAKEFIKALNFKLNRKNCSSEEYRAIFRLFGLLSVGFDHNFPITNFGLNSEDKDSWRRLLGALGRYIWWSIASRNIEENVKESQEPLDLVNEDSLRGPHYTLDFDDMCRMIQNGSGEDCFKECFNTFVFTNENGEEQHRYYKSTSDANEYKRSVEQATKLITSLQAIYLAKRNLHKYRVQRTDHPCFGMSFLQMIDYYAGKRYFVKKIIIEGEEIDCKKMSPKILVDYHTKQLQQMFWSAYRSQQEEGIIITLETNTNSKEIASEMPT